MVYIHCPVNGSSRWAVHRRPEIPDWIAPNRHPHARHEPCTERSPALNLRMFAPKPGEPDSPGRLRTGNLCRVTKIGRLDAPEDDAFLALFGAIASRDQLAIGRWLDEEPGLATHPIRVGASRQDPDTYFLHSIHHYVYAGDTALHIAAAAHQRELAESLIAQGADIRARNRRGAEPLHYAADGSPGAANSDRNGPRQVITYLIEEGADPIA